ncbi:ChuX/HutX family heme-like substrate-binding protein [Azohydromonas lata]|uniref:ChuX/HutX family heme-like substrate-binding protein n=1 Tax=Azohydromonas lata TaxID=45677 RepID=A0ABU5IN19_9BURK|nr:ChuX/HutX family heme-like substrate-binding protein [Azohydromonas lata]MDZ5460270.1 ChuX/HutX family heme-like substrate-binding protein [Azohydromonas lata]
MAATDKRAEARPLPPTTGATERSASPRRHAPAGTPASQVRALPSLVRRRALRSPGLRAAYARERAAQPQARRGDVALALGVTEGELIAAHAGLFQPALSSLSARHLLPQWRRIAAALPALGVVRSITGNRWCRLENTSAAQELTRRCEQAAGDAPACTCLADAAAAGAWAHGFAIEERGADGRVERSLQFFDLYGQSVAEVVLLEGSRVEAFLDIVESFSSWQLAPGLVIPVKKPAAAPRRMAVAAFDSAVAGEGGTATRLPNASTHQVLAGAAHSGVPLTLRVESRGGRLSRSGALQDVRLDGPWLHARGAGHGLRLRADAIAQTWLLRRPTPNGTRHALVLLDAAGEPIASISAETDAEGSERGEWRSLLSQLAAQA